MTSSAGASAAIRVHSSNTTVRPSIGIKLPLFHILDLAAVTLPASVLRGRAALNYLSQHVVQRPDELRCPSMMTLLELLYLFAVTAAAVVGCDNHGNAMAVVLKCCRVFLVGAMARVAVHILFGVRAFSPLLHNSRRTAAVAIQAYLTFGGYLGNCDEREQEKTEKNSKAHGNLHRRVRPTLCKGAR